MADFPGMMVPVGADDSGLRRVLSQAEARVDQFAGRVDGSVRRASSSFDALGRSASGVATAVVALAGVQLGAGAADSLVEATRAAMAFQTAIAQVGTLLKGADTSRYAAQVKDLARQFGGLPTDQAKALYEVISAGAYSAANAISVLTEANRLAIGGVTDVQTAADGLTSVLNSYGAAAGGAANVADAFFASAAAGKTNIKELASYIGQVAPIAAQTGVSLDELMAAAAALTANGIKTSTAMDGMRSVIAAVLKPSQEATATARALGLEFNAGALKAKGLANFLQEVADKTGGSSESMALLFGGVEALLPVMALASRESTAFADAQQELQNKVGATEAAYSRLAETGEQVASRLRAAAEVYRVELGDRLLSAVQPAMAGLADNFDRVTAAAEATALALGAAFVARGIGPAIQAAGQFAASQVALRKELLTNTGHLLQKEAALRAGAAATVEAAAADVAAAQAAQAKARSDLAARATQYEAAAALDAAIGKTARLVQAEEALIAARTARAAADARVAETTVALTMAQSAQASAIAGTGVAATVASRGMALLSGAMALVGGPVGAALLAGAAAVAVFSSGMTASEKATRLHSDAMRDFDSAFDRSTGKVKTMTEAVAALRRQNLEAARDAALAAVKQEETYARAGSFKIDRAAYESGLSKEDAAKVFGPARELQQQFLAGAIDAEALFAAIDKLASQDARLKPLVKAFAEWAAPLAKAKQEVKETEAGLALLNGTADDAAKAVLGVGTNAGTAASGFQTMGGEVAGLTAKLADLVAKSKQLEVPAGYQRRLAELVGPEPTNGDAKDLDLWRRKRDAADATLRPIVGLETRDQTAELERQANGQRLLAGAVTDAAKAHAQNRIELAKVAVEYPGLGAETAKTLLTTKDFGAVLKSLPLDLQQRWAVLQSSSQAQLAGAAAQGTLQLQLQTDAQARLAAAAGKGEAATRRATIENQVAAAAVRGLSAATRTNLEAQERSTQQQLRTESTQPILARIEAQKALVAAYGQGPQAVKAAELAEQAHTLALKEGEQGTQLYTEAKAHYIELLTQAQQLESAVAAGPMLQRQRDQLELGQKQLQLIGASAEQRAVELARTQALIDLRERNIDAASREGQAYLANAEALARQNLALERTNAAYQELEQFGDRSFDAILQKLSAAGKSTMSWADAIGTVSVELQQLALKMAVINPLKNMVMGSNLPTVFDLFGGSGEQSGQAQGGGLTGSLTNTALSKGAGWALDKLIPGGLSGAIDSFGYSALGIGSQATTLAGQTVLAPSAEVLASQTAMLQAANPGLAVSASPTVVAGSSGGAAGGVAAGTGLSAYLGAAGAGAFGGMGGAYLGTLTNSKVVGGLSGAALGAGASALAAYMGLGAIGGPIGLAIGAVVGGIMGMLGTQKATVGPNSSGNVVLDGKGGFRTDTALADNGADAGQMQQLTDAVAASMNTVVAGIGGKLTGGDGANTGLIQQFAKDGKWYVTPSVGEKAGQRVEFTDQDQAIAFYMRESLKGLIGTGQLTGVNDDVKKALTTSKATKAEELATDLGFAAGFRQQLDVMNASLDPTNNLLKTFTENAKAIGDQVKTNITDWRSKASELGLATETELTAAARKGIEAMMGLGPATKPLVGMAAATKQAEIEFEQFRPALLSLGYTTGEVAELAARYTRRLQDSYADAVAYVQRQGAVAIEALINPNAKSSALDRLQGLGLDRTNSAIKGLAGVIEGVEQAASGGTLTIEAERAALGRLNSALYDGTITGDQYSTMVGYLTQAWSDSADAAEKAVQKASWQADVTSRMYAALGNSRGAGLIALDAQQAAALAEATAAGYDTTQLRLVQMAERASQAFSLAQQDLLDAYDREIAAKHQVVDSIQSGAIALLQAARQFRDARAALREGDDSPLAPRQKIQEATDRFDAAYAVLKNGSSTDAEKETARQTLLQVGPTLVALEKAASGGTASVLWDKVDRVFAELGNTSGLSLDTATQDLQVAQDQLKELQKARADAAAIGQRQLGSLSGLRDVMDQSYAVWQSALTPLMKLTNGNDNRPRYSAPAAVQTAWERLSGAQQAGIASSMGWGGKLDEAFNVWLAMDSGRASRFGEAVLTATPSTPAAPAETTEQKRQRLQAFSLDQIEATFGAFPDIQAERARNPGFNLARWFLDNGIDEVLAGTRRIPGFATGGISFGPQLAWVSEGAHTAEAHVPLPDGRRIPVALDLRLPGSDLEPPAPMVSFRRPDLDAGGAGVAELLEAVEGLRDEVRAIGRDALTQRARIGADAAALLARVEAATSDLPRKLANTRRAA
ncbi:phage tail tape measure protein [Azospirillum sp. B21]|uniref:phage tail tape measure protein n=1 Tax=Azospirillum sp. B21 TaxID=2607496 RepID=UPI0011EBC7C9|nr:phage tail tape measure protein [Azospirillum sp. B21]KAA0578848.1 phage tail tape measure protein [Azospirillum sp. B21]